MKKSILSFIGFLLFITGFVALCLNMINAQLSYLSWMKDLFGPLYALVIQFCMILFGLIIVILAQTNFGKEE